MRGAAFFFEDVTKNFTSGQIGSNLDRMVYNCRMLGCTHLFMIDITEFQIGQYYQHADSLIEFERYTSLDELEAAYPSANFYYLENSATLSAAGVTNFVDLCNHTPPVGANDIYVVGGDFSGNVVINGREDKNWICIQSAADLWAETALALILCRCLYCET
jgi:hypothetical protein